VKKNYPLNRELKNHYWVALALGLWIVLFLYFSKPFGINDIPNTKLFFLLPFYGILQSISYCLPLFYQNKNLSKDNDWAINNELIFLGLTIVFGAIINFGFYKYFVVSNINYAFNFIEYLQLFYLPALTIVLPFIIMSRFLLGKFSEKNNTEAKITIKGKGQYDFINLKAEALVFIQSSDNYIEINFIEHKTIKKKLIRGTISEVEQTFPELLKPHRSYLHFKQFKTENKKLFLDLGMDIIVPVSRSLQTSVKNKLPITKL